MKIKPLGSWVLLRKKKDSEARGGLILPEIVDSYHLYVEAVSNEVTDLKVGDEVMHIPTQNGVAHSDLKDCFMVPRTAIIAVIER